MGTKKSVLSSDLIAVKGQAKPSPVISNTPDKSKLPSSEYQPLNFKVSSDFKRDFRLVAAQNDLKLVELLEQSFAAYKREKGI